MTTPQAAIAKAEELANVIERQWPGWDAPVPEVWCRPPADRAGICGQTGAQHCAGSVWRIYDEIGLVAGAHYPIPDNGLFVFCPDIAEASDAGGFTADEPAPGDCLLLDWEGDGTQDHATLCIGVDNWPASATVRGFNTDESGHGLVHERPAGVVSRIIRPRWPGDAIATGTAAAAPPPPKHFALLGGDMILMVPLTDGSGHNYFDLIGGVLLWRGNDGVKNNTGPVVEFDSEESFKAFYRRYCQLLRINALSGQPL